MPTRILRDGILTSELVNKLTEKAENLYRRMMSVVDDYGRYYGHLTLIRAACYPLMLDEVTDRQVGQMIDELISNDLVLTYSVNDKKYIEINNFGQRTRNESKFPAPPPHNDGELAADTPQESGLVVDEGVVVDEGEGVYKGQNKFDLFWDGYPKKRKKKQARDIWKRKQLDKKITEIITDVKIRIEHDERWKRGYVPDPTTYLNGERWDDECEMS